MIGIAFLAYALLTWLRPRLALWVLLFVIPFGHLVRFSVAGMPFTFVEVAVYVLAIAIGLRTTVYRLRLPTPSRSPSRREGEKKNSFPTSHREGGRRGGGGLTPYALRLTSRLRDPWLLLPLLWVLVAVVAAVGSPAGVRAWGIWKAYFVAPVLLFWIIRYVFQRTPVPSSVGSGISNGEFLISKQIPNTNDQHLLPLTSYLLPPLALGALIIAAIAIVQRWWPIGVPYPWSLPGKFRATSVFGYPNAVGLYLAPLVPLIVGAALVRWTATPSRSPCTLCVPPPLAPPLKEGEDCSRSEGEKKIVSPLPAGRGGTGGWGAFFRPATIITALISVITIALARSTGALVALAVVLPVLILLSWHFHTRTPSPPSSLGAPDAYFHDRRNRRLTNGWTAGLIGAWIVASLLLTLWLPNQREKPKWGPPIVQKLTFQKWSGSVRLAQYRETWELLRDHPIRGAGLAGYQTAIRPYHKDSRVEIFLYPHNLLLAVWAELGLAGLLVFLAILYQFFRDALVRCQVSGVRCAIIASMLVMLVHGLVDVPYFKNDLAMVFWVIVALGIAASAGKPGDHLTAAASPPMLPSR